MASKSIREKVQVHLFRQDPATGEVRYLVLKRSPEKQSIWQPVTGNIDGDEDLLTGARREVEEETGLANLPLCREVSRFEFENKGRKFRETVYAAECPPRGQVRLSKEHVEYQWVSYEEARRLIHFESNRDALDRVHQSIRGTTQQESSAP